jgi:electron transfer flavoprotein alpha subunit
MPNDILIFAEQRGGKVNPASFQLLALAAQLARSTNGAVAACVVGQNVAGHAAALAEHGASKVYVVDDARLATYRAMPYAAAVAGVIESAKPKAVLFPTTFLGRDLASRVAAKCHAALAIDCTELKYEGADLVAVKTMYAGKFSATFRLTGTRLQVATVRSNAYAAAAPQAGATPTLSNVPLGLRPADERLTLRKWWPRVQASRT